ncbi:MAG TPA: hypothetical protein VGK49_01235 [Ilumatobacteraceae bacterium]
MSLRERIARSSAELDALHLQERWNGVPVTNIAELAERCPVRFGGEVRGQRHSGHGDQPTLHVTITDGTGRAELLFSGRSRIAGIVAGRAMLVEGVGRRDGNRFVVRDPAYTLLSGA